MSDESTYDGPRNQQSVLQPPGKARKCPHCSREFKKNDHYDRHVRSHTNEKPYGCRICGKFYPRRYGCQRVMSSSNGANQRRDTLLRHCKTHEVIRGKHTSSRTARNDVHQHSSSYTTLDQDTHVPSAGLPQELAVFDNITANIYDDGVAFRPPFAELQSANVSNLHAPTASPGTHPLGHWPVDKVTHPSVSLASSGQRPTFDSFSSPQLTNTETSGLDHFTFDDTMLQFDTTNWLLDDTFADIGNDDSAVHEPWAFSSQSQLKPADLPSTRASDRPPSIADLRRMWFRDIWSHNGNENEVHSVGTESNDIDENYLTEMVQALGTPVPNEPLPSIDLLVHFPRPTTIFNLMFDAESMHSSFLHPLQRRTTSHSWSNLQTKC